MREKDRTKTLLLAALVTFGAMGLCMTAFWLVNII